MFRVTHIDPAGHRRKARVTGSSVANCMDQMEAQFGPAVRLCCVRLQTRPVLHLVHRLPDQDERSAPCVH